MDTRPPKPHDNDRDRCTHETRIPGSADKLRCGDKGAWTLDKKAKTWRASNPSDRSRKCWAHGPGSIQHAYGPRSRKTKPNARTQRVAVRLLAVGTEITRALEAVNDELSMLGFPGTSSTGGGTGNLDPMGDDATRISDLSAWKEDLRDAITAVDDAAAHVIRLVARHRRLPPAIVTWRDSNGTHVSGTQGIKLCCDALHDRDGSIEWGDPTCTEIPTRSGLCAACFERERRWRKANHFEDLAEPAA